MFSVINLFSLSRPITREVGKNLANAKDISPVPQPKSNIKDGFSIFKPLYQQYH